MRYITAHFFLAGGAAAFFTLDAFFGAAFFAIAGR